MSLINKPHQINRIAVGVPHRRRSSVERLERVQRLFFFVFNRTVVVRVSRADCSKIRNQLGHADWRTEAVFFFFFSLSECLQNVKYFIMA